MSTITVHLRGLTGSVDLEVPEDGSVADVRAAAEVNDSIGFAVGGQRVDRDAEGRTPLGAEQTITTLPPEVKAGA